MILPSFVATALAKLRENGFEAFVVGGAVRDFLQGNTPCDYDITTPSTPEETKAVFDGYTVFLQGERHGTVGVIIDGEKLEITTHRRDGEYLDHRRPESVDFSRRLPDDLSRRDFTVNAMAFSPETGVVDLFGGREDLENKIIRCVGTAEVRFEEDALRILRALRFSSRLSFDIEENTRRAIFDKRDLIKTVSGERVRDELLKLVSGVGALEVIRDFLPVFEVIFKRIDISVIDSPLWDSLSFDARLALFFIAIDDENKYSRLKFSNEEKHFFVRCEELYKNPFFDRFSLKKALCTYGVRVVEAVLELISDKSLSHVYLDIVQKGECFLKKDMKITGADLAEIGFSKGREMGQMLDGLFDLVLKNEIENRKDALIEYAKKQVK